MKPVDKIIEYMKLKQSLTHEKYLVDQDIVDIKNLPEDISEKIWRKISLCNVYGRFTVDDCPFCILQEIRKKSCRSCPYGKRHGMCLKDDSDWENYISKTLKSSNDKIVLEFSELLNSFESLSSLKK